MIEMGLHSIDAAIADGITLLRDLTVRTAPLMYSMYSACPPLESLRAHHVGLLAPPGEAEALRTVIDAHGLRVVSVFPSAVVAAELAGQYRRPVHIHVYCCRPAAGATQTLEIFHVTDGLNDAQIRAAITGVRHVAFSLAPGTDIQNLWKRGWRRRDFAALGAESTAMTRVPAGASPWYIFRRCNALPSSSRSRLPASIQCWFSGDIRAVPRRVRRLIGDGEQPNGPHRRIFAVAHS